jgi:hypothetical protein
MTHCKEPQKRRMQVGEEIKLMPMTAQDQDATGDMPNVRVYFTFGASAVEYQDEIDIKMYGDDDKLLHQLRGTDLQHTWKSTQCDSELVSKLDNALSGDALFCGGVLKPSIIRLFQGTRADGAIKTATSFTVEEVNENLKFQSINVSFQ